MNYIDLHVHSNVSDGTFTPAQLVELAVKKQLSAFALTDHDTVEGIPKAIEAAALFQKKGIHITVIPGIELSVAYKKRDIHMLGLMIDYKNPSFCNTLHEIQQERDERNYKMVENLANAGIDISMEKLREIDRNAILTRAHFAKYLTEHHYTKTTKDAFFQYLGEDGPYYVSRKYISPEEAIALIRSVGGVPILAHPLLYKLPPDELDALVKHLAEYGLAGIEAIYSSNIGYDEQNMKKLAQKYNLLITGGSDFHGANKPYIELGTGRGNLKISNTMLDSLINWKNSYLN